MLVSPWKVVVENELETTLLTFNGSSVLPN